MDDPTLRTPPPGGRFVDVFPNPRGISAFERPHRSTAPKRPPGRPLPVVPCQARSSRRSRRHTQVHPREGIEAHSSQPSRTAARRAAADLPPEAALATSFPNQPTSPLLSTHADQPRQNSLQVGCFPSRRLQPNRLNTFTRTPLSHCISRAKPHLIREPPPSGLTHDKKSPPHRREPRYRPCHGQEILRRRLARADLFPAAVQ